VIIEKAGMKNLLPSLESEGLIQTRSSLIGRLRHWDDSLTWSEFFETYWRFMYRCAIKAGLSDQEAQEVVQGTMITVAKKMRAGTYRHDSKVATFRTWLWRIVQFHILQQRRLQGRSQRFVAIESASTDEDGDSEFDQMAGFAGSLEEDWDMEWLQNFLNAAADRVKRQVNPVHYQIFSYRVIQGHSVAETARALRTNVAQVYLVTHRVAKALRHEFERLREIPPTLFVAPQPGRADNLPSALTAPPSKTQT